MWRAPSTRVCDIRGGPGRLTFYFSEHFVETGTVLYFGATVGCVFARGMGARLFDFSSVRDPPSEHSHTRLAPPHALSTINHPIGH